MLYLLAHIYIHPGQELAFNTYENQVLPIFKEYGGTVILAIRPEVAPNVAGPETPYEIHVLSISSEEAFNAYRLDPRVSGLSESRMRIFRKLDIFRASQRISYDSV